MEIKYTYSPRTRCGMQSDFLTTISYTQVDEDAVISGDPVIKKQLRAMYSAVLETLTEPMKGQTSYVGHLETELLPPTQNKIHRLRARFWYKIEGVNE